MTPIQAIDRLKAADILGTSDAEKGGLKARIATGKMCRCLECYCCEEWLKSIAKAKGGE